jgi:hypothetical protein
MCLGTHTKYSRAHLGVDSRKLEQCTAECDCMEFWSIDMPADRCWLRRAAMRVLCAQPTPLQSSVSGVILQMILQPSARQ